MSYSIHKNCKKCPLDGKVVSFEIQGCFTNTQDPDNEGYEFDYLEISNGERSIVIYENDLKWIMSNLDRLQCRLYPLVGNSDGAKELADFFVKEVYLECFSDDCNGFIPAYEDEDLKIPRCKIPMCKILMCA